MTANRRLHETTRATNRTLLGVVFCCCFCTLASPCASQTAGTSRILQQRYLNNDRPLVAVVVASSRHSLALSRTINTARVSVSASIDRVGARKRAADVNLPATWSPSRRQSLHRVVPSPSLSQSRLAVFLPLARSFVRSLARSLALFRSAKTRQGLQHRTHTRSGSRHQTYRCASFLARTDSQALARIQRE